MSLKPFSSRGILKSYRDSLDSDERYREAALSADIGRAPAGMDQVFYDTDAEQLVRENGGSPLVLGSSHTGTSEQLATYVAGLPAGTEYVWTLTDGAGTVLNIVSGVAPEVNA